MKVMRPQDYRHELVTDAKRQARVDSFAAQAIVQSKSQLGDRWIFFVSDDDGESAAALALIGTIGDISDFGLVGTEVGGSIIWMKKTPERRRELEACFPGMDIDLPPGKLTAICNRQTT